MWTYIMVQTLITEHSMPKLSLTSAEWEFDWFLLEEVLWSVRISGSQYCSQYVFESSSRFFTFKQKKIISIFIISSWTISYRTSAKVEIPPVTHPSDIYRPYSRPDLLNWMPYKLQKDRSYALKSLIIQSAVFSWRQSKMPEISGI